jgi:hypothetical protein
VPLPLGVVATETRRRARTRDPDWPTLHERSLASTLHKRDSRAKIPDLSGMVVGGKLQVQKTTDTNITVWHMTQDRHRMPRD